MLPSSVIDQLDSGRQRKIWIVKGGYCADTRCAKKMTGKTERHEKLVDKLKMYGHDVHLRPMPLGYAGTIYNYNLSVLQDLGLQRTVAAVMLITQLLPQQQPFSSSRNCASLIASVIYLVMFAQSAVAYATDTSRVAFPGLRSIAQLGSKHDAKSRMSSRDAIAKVKCCQGIVQMVDWRRAQSHTSGQCCLSYSKAEA